MPVNLYYITPDEKVMFFGESARTGGFAWNHFIWEVVADFIGVDFVKTFLNLSGDGQQQKEDMGKVWNAHIHNSDMVHYMKIALACSWDCPHFTKERILDIINCLGMFWRKHSKENLSKTVLNVVDLLSDLYKSDVDYIGFFLSVLDDPFIKPEIREELEPLEDEEERTLITIKKHLTLENVINNRGKMQYTENLWGSSNFNSYFIGQGSLNWNGGERISDRYGYIGLFDENNEDHLMDFSEESKKLKGRHGSFRVEVVEYRRSDHIGDLFRGFSPEKPDKETYMLGTGTLSFTTIGEWEYIGLVPDDGRSDNWLDPEVLYKVHTSIVKLYFVESNSK